jgi:hypothetical protein
MVVALLMVAAEVPLLVGLGGCLAQNKRTG